jgi:D-alanine-D-alanine ligase
MRVGIAFDLKVDAPASPFSGCEDRLEEYDTAATVDAIADALDAIGCKSVRLGGGPGFVRRLAAERVDLVFNISEGWGTRCREAQTPAVCELLEVRRQRALGPLCSAYPSPLKY